MRTLQPAAAREQPVTQSRGDVPAWEYRLDAWDDASRRSLGEQLIAAGIPSEWDGARCRVPHDRHDDADRVIASMRVAPTPPPPPPPPPAPRVPPGWYPDPWGASPARWWDGVQWTGFVVQPEAPERSWIPPHGSRELAIRGGGIAFTGFVAAIVASGLAVVLFDLLGGSVHSLEALCIGQAALWACLFVSCKVAVRRHGTGSLRDLGLVAVSRRQAGAGVVVGLVARFGAGALAVALTELLPKEQLRDTAEPVVQLHSGILPITVVALILVVGAPFFEELFFRGLVQGAFTNRFGARVAVFAQAACFGLVHYRVGMSFTQTVITVVTIGATGCVLGATRWHYEKLGPGMVAHAVFNAFVVLVVVLA
jgi:membrane protease YdiL (CAAX protease family)